MRLRQPRGSVAPIPDPPDDFMTVAEVAALLKLNQQTVRNWIDAGTLPGVRVGRRVRIKRSDFDAVIEASYSGRAPTTETNIWHGDVPSPDVPD
jgi:excisionase family DNA binding protein